MAALNDSIKMITSVKTVNCVLYSEFFHKPKQNKTNNEDTNHILSHHCWGRIYNLANPPKPSVASM